MTKSFNNRYAVTFLLYKVDKTKWEDNIHAEMNQYMENVLNQPLQNLMLWWTQTQNAK